MLALKSACDPTLLPHEWKNGCIEELLTEKDCLSLRTIGPFQECVGSCMSQYGFQRMLCPRLLRSKGLLSVFMKTEGSGQVSDSLIVLNLHGCLVSQASSGPGVCELLFVFLAIVSRQSMLGL